MAIQSITIRTNAAQGTAVQIDDLGIVIPASGGSDVFDTENEILEIIRSSDLRTLLTDNTFAVNDSTLILNDGSSDIPQADIANFLNSALADDSEANYGYVTTNGSGEVEDDVEFDGSATISNVLLGTDLDGNGFEITNISDPTTASSAATRQWTENLVSLSVNWQGAVLVVDQLDSTNDALSQAGAYYWDSQPSATNTFVITDGATTETFTCVNTEVAAFDVAIGADVDAFQTNLVQAINDDSTLWSAVLTTSLNSVNDGSGASAAGAVVVVFRSNNSAQDSFDDRAFGTFTTQADARYINFNDQLTNYEKNSDSELPSADPAQKEFGFGTATANLRPGESHTTLDSDMGYTWDADSAQWSLSASGTINYGVLADIQEVAGTNDPGVLSRVARADHAHAHGYRGGDPAGLQHDADQVGLDAVLDLFGAVGGTPLETVITNIHTLFRTFRVGQNLIFGSRQRVPGGGTRVLSIVEQVASSSVTYVALRDLTITGAAINVDNADATRTYDLSIRANNAQIGTITLGTGVTTATSTSLSLSVTAGQTISLAMVRASGSGSSSFDDISANIEFYYD